MKTIKRNKSSIILTIILVLLLSLLVVLKFSGLGLAADDKNLQTNRDGASPEKQTADSKDRVVYNVKEWTAHVDDPGVHDIKHPPQAPSLRDLLPADQVKGDGVYITATDLHSIPSLFCTHKNCPLPGYASTVVSSNGYSTDITDQGIKTAFLTKNDVDNSTVTTFRNDDRLLSGWEVTGTHSNKLSATTSKTLGFFDNCQILPCTPVEAYIMAEYMNNTSGMAASFEWTNQEYKGKVPTRADNGNAATAFAREINSVAQFVYNQRYSYGNLGTIPPAPKYNKETGQLEYTGLGDKKINNRDAIRWALYGIGYNVSAGNLESSLKSNGWEAIAEPKVEALKAGDIVFLKNESDSDGVIVINSKSSVYDLSTDQKIITPQPMARDLKIEDIAKVYRLPINAKVNNQDSAAVRYDVEALRIDGTDIFLVGDPGNEKYVAKKDGKYYYVNINGDENWTPNSDAQNAWWEKSTKSIENGSSGFKHVPLADEAQAFEDYVLAVNGVSSTGALKKNENGTFNIDYKTDFEPKDPKQINVRFNSLENKYIIGPFIADYTRAVTKVDGRPTISFAGISRTVLVAVDAEGHELTNEDGTNRLKINENYRFVYEDPADHENRKPKEDKDAKENTDYHKYNYPYPGEQFYLSVDYIDDMAQIKNFKMDFQYTTAGGEYEYFTGNFLIIQWEPASDKISTRATSETGAFIQHETTSVAMNDQTSNRVGNVSNRAGGAIADITASSYKELVKFNEVEGGNLSGGGDVDIKNQGLTITKDGNTFSYKINVVLPSGYTNGTYGNYGYSHASYSFKSISVTVGGQTKTSTSNPATLTFNKDKSSPIIEADVSATVTYEYEWEMMSGSNGMQGGKQDKTHTETGKIKYYNSFLKEDSAKVNNVNNGDIKIEDNVIYKKGYVHKDTYTLDFDAFDPAKGGDETIEASYFNYTYFAGTTGLRADDTKKGKYKIHSSGEPYSSNPKCYVEQDGTKTEEVEYNPVYVHKMCDDDKNNSRSESGESGEIQLWDAFLEVNQTSHTRAEAGLPNVVNFYLSGGKLCWNVGVTKEGGTETVEITNECGDTYTLTVTYGGQTGGGDPDPGPDPGPGTDPTPGGEVGDGSSESQYHDFLTATGTSSEEAQEQSNAIGDHKVVDVDAEDGLGDTQDGQPVEIEFVIENIELRTSIGGVVWVDHEGDKDEATSGKMGIADNYNAKEKKWTTNGDRANKDSDYPVEANSVEIVVWKVKYIESGSGDSKGLKEVERTKAIGWTKDGKEINFIENDGRLFVDNNGNYYIDKIQVPSVEGKESGVIYSYDVEFIYDGQTYETTDYLIPTSQAGNHSDEDASTRLKRFTDISKNIKDYKDQKSGSVAPNYTDFSNSSYIVENKAERNNFDSYFTEVFGEKNASDYKAGEGAKSAMTAEKTDGYATGGRAGSYYAGQIEDTYIENPVNDTASLEYKTVDLNSDEKTKTVDGSAVNDQIKQSIVQTRRDGDFIRDQYRFSARTSEGGLLLPYDSLYHVESQDPLCYLNLTYAKDQYKPIDEYFDQINMGLLERYKTDISLVKDLYTAKTLVNNTELTMTYNHYRALTEANLRGRFKLLPESRTYKIDLYNADYFYRSSVYNTIADEVTKEIVTAVKKGTDLRLFLTYRIAITNGSDNTNVSINEFKDYYDESFTLVTEDIVAQVRQSQQEPIEDTDAYVAEVHPNNTLVEKVVATTPHYRKLKSNITDAEIGELYKHNWKQDSEAGAIDTASADGKDGKVTGDVVFTKLDGSALALDNQKEASNGFKAVRSTSLRGLNEKKDGLDARMVLEPGEVMEVFVTYEVDRERFYEIYNAADGTQVARDALLGSKNNIAEVTRYTTQYTTVNGSKYKNGLRHSNVAYKVGEISGRIDQDSAPDNANITAVTTLEQPTDNTGVLVKAGEENAKQKVLDFYDDDTCSAPTVKINVRQPEISRTLEGTVWDDGKGVQDTLAGERIADGIYDENTEPGINGVDTTLVEKIHITAEQYNAAKQNDNAAANVLGNDLSTLDYEFEFVWPTDAFVNSFNGEYKANSTDKTKDNGDKKGYYKFTNFAAGDYVVRFEYGNTEDTLQYNGQDYKNTYYQTQLTLNGEKTEVTGKTGITNPANDNKELFVPGTEDTEGNYTLNNEWHNLKVEKAQSLRYSDARDYEPRRLQVMGYSRMISNENAEVLSAYINGDLKDKLTDEYKAIIEANKDKLIENTKMVANTAKFSVEIEDQSLVDYTDVKHEEGDAGTNTIQPYEIKNIDFGLALRPETKLNIQTEINQITLSKNDGADVVLSVFMDNDGNIIKDKSQLEKLRDDLTEEEYNELMESIERRLGDTQGFRKITEIDKANLPVGSQGFKYVAIEESYLNGMDVDLKYKISVYNNSDLDYVGSYVANIKNPQELFALATRFEAGGDYSELDFQNSPFNTGKRIVYGKYVGLNYYAGEIAEANNGDLTKIKDDLGKKYLDPKYYYDYSETATSGGEAVTINPHSKDIYKADVLVSTTVDQVVDYIDNDIARVDDTTAGGRVINHSWDDSTQSDRDNKISRIAYTTDEGGNAKLLDYKEREYVTSGRNNIAFSHNETITSTPVDITYATVKVSQEEINATREANEAVVKQLIESTQPVDELVKEKAGEEAAEAEKKTEADNTVADNHLVGVHNLTPTLTSATFKSYSTFGNDVTTGRLDTANTILTNELLPNRAFDANADTRTKKTGAKYQTTAEEASQRYSSYVYLLTTTQASAAKIGDMNFDNLSEIAIYSNTVGRKDMRTITGDANQLGKTKSVTQVGYNIYVDTVSKENNQPVYGSVADFFKAKADTNAKEADMKVNSGEDDPLGGLNVQRDSYSARDTVMFSEPTGLSSGRIRMNQIVRVILIGLTIAAFAVIGITVGMVVKKTKYDDKNLINTDKN